MEAIKILNVILPYNLYEKLDSFCKSEQFTKAHIVRTAIERELRRRVSKIQSVET